VTALPGLGTHARRGTGGLPAGAILSWVLVLGFAVATLGAVVTGRSSALKYAYPAGALAVGVVLYRYRPVAYPGFVWWLWFLTPLVRRLVDYRLGYDPINLVLTAPVLVTGISVWSLVRHFPKLKRRSLAALLPIGISLVYAYPIGIRSAGLQAATFSLLQWLVPIAFGFHLATDAARYPEYRATTRRVFLWAAFLLGIYGVWQFLSPPMWDRYWMLHAEMSTIGKPLPAQVRVFSTVNSPTPFAMVMVAGLLMLLETRVVRHVLIGAPAYLAFLLSLVRTAWAGWLLGIGVYATYLGSRARSRLLLTVALLGIGIGALTATSLADRVAHRFETFTDLDEDKSLLVRQESAGFVLQLIMEEPLGQGLGATGSAKRLANGTSITFDNGLLNLFFSLGWLGGILYLLGAVIALAGLVRRFEPRADPIPKVARAVTFATFGALASFNTLIGVSGVLFWAFVGLSLSAKSWYWAADQAAQLEEEPPVTVGTYARAEVGRAG
jgi:hypothetical protein